MRFLEWLAREHPDAGGYWPAQAVANHALGGTAAIDTTVAMTALPLFDFQGWDAAVAAKAGVDDIARLPRIVVGTEPVGRVDDAGARRWAAAPSTPSPSSSSPAPTTTATCS